MRTKVGQDVCKEESFTTVSRAASWCSHCRNQCEAFSREQKTELPYDPAIPILGIIPKVKRRKKDAPRKRDGEDKRTQGRESILGAKGYPGKWK